MQFGFLLEQVVNGLVLGGYYLLIALGLSLIFSVGGIVNLAHGAFYALGAYASIEITRYLGFGSPAAPIRTCASARVQEVTIAQRCCGSAWSNSTAPGKGTTPSKSAISRRSISRSSAA